MEENLERRTIEAGTVLHLNGIPIRVCEQFEAETHRNNWGSMTEPARSPIGTSGSPGE